MSTAIKAKTPMSRNIIAMIMTSGLNTGKASGSFFMLSRIRQC